MSVLTIDADLKYFNHLSNAVLTPHLNHPNFKHVRAVGSAKYLYSKGNGEDFKQQAERWCKRQLEQLKNNPSNAVLRGDHGT